MCSIPNRDQFIRFCSTPSCRIYLFVSRSATTSIRSVLFHAGIGSSPTCRVSPCLVSIDHVVRNALHFNGGSATTSSNDTVASVWPQIGHVSVHIHNSQSIAIMPSFRHCALLGLNSALFDTETGCISVRSAPSCRFCSMSVLHTTTGHT